MKQLSKELLLLLCAVVSCGAAWAQGNVAWVKVTDYSNLSTNDTYVIVWNGISSINHGTVFCSLKNNQVSSAAYLPIGKTIATYSTNVYTFDDLIINTFNDNDTWTLETTGISGVYYIKSTKGNYYLQNAASSKSTIDQKTRSVEKNCKWRIHYEATNSSGKKVTGLYNYGQTRVFALYYTDNNTDWRSYGPSGYGDFEGAEVVLYRKVITSATIGAAEYATFSCPAALDFSAETGLTIYTVAVNADETEVTLTEVANKQVPANTAVVLHGPSGTYTGQVLASATPISNNHLKIAESEMSGAAGNIYVLNKKNGVVGFYKLSDSGTLAAGKAYLQLTNPAPMLTMTEEETTGIQSLTSSLSQGEGDCYDLSGRRVSQPKNGLYIVNGRKVVIK